MQYYEGFETDVDLDALADDLEMVSDVVWGSDHEHSVVASVLLMMARDAALLLTDCDMPDFWANLSSNLRHIAGYSSSIDGLDESTRVTMTAICSAEQYASSFVPTRH